jgi:hypothetical protein
MSQLICDFDPSECTTTEYDISLDGLFLYALTVDVYPSLLGGEFDNANYQPNWLAQTRKMNWLMYIIGLELFVEIFRYFKKKII